MWSENNATPHTAKTRTFLMWSASDLLHIDRYVESNVNRH